MSSAIAEQVGKHPALRTYLVWVPVLMARESHVANGTNAVKQPGIAHYWDGHSALVRGYMQPLGLSQLAWDVYMIYGPDAQWGEEGPPVPDFWMHQLPGVDAPRLDAEAFTSRLTSELPGPAGLEG